MTRKTPYLGLSPFTIADAPFFFGRESETDIIASNLITQRLTLLYGPSGIGKSSVLQAGVISKLYARARADMQTAGAPEYIVLYHTGWSGDPLSDLLNDAAATLQVFFSEPFVPADGLIGSIREWNKQTGAELLFILDQFEEYFLYHRNDPDQDSFVVNFSNALKQKDLPANFLVAFRDDSHSQFHRFKARIPNIFDNTYLLRHLTIEGGRAAILKPVEKYNELREPEEPAMEEPEQALVETVLSQVRVGQISSIEGGRGTTAESQDIETPYLQLVMAQLWKKERENKSNRLQLETLTNMGGAQKIVRNHLNETLAHLSSPQQEIIARTFEYLVTPSGTKIAQTASDLANYADVSENELVVILRDLAGGPSRILRPIAPAPDRPKEQRYEIFHDVLASAILGWQDDYQNKRKTEQERQHTRRLLVLVFGISTVFLLFLGLTYFGYEQRQEAQAAAANAQTQVAFAQDAQNIAQDLRTALAASNNPTNQSLIKTAEAVGTSAGVAQTQAVNTLVKPNEDVNATGTAVHLTANATDTSTPSQTPTATVTPVRALTFADTTQRSGEIVVRQSPNENAIPVGTIASNALVNVVAVLGDWANIVDDQDSIRGWILLRNLLFVGGTITSKIVTPVTATPIATITRIPTSTSTLRPTNTPTFVLTPNTPTNIPNGGKGPTSAPVIITEAPVGPPTRPPTVPP